MEAEVWNVLPVNGLDRSLHLPVLVGLLIVSFFRETLGWTYAGLVVPGYLASVALAAPVTAGVVVAESIPAYLMALAIGKWLPTTGAWSTFFGRERFLLLIVTSLLARLFVETLAVPQLVELFPARHSRELYSLGLVLVPLLANSYWNAGLRVAGPRVMIAAALTWLFVDQVLLEYTNFSVARFQMANESVSLAFLETPHAHIILLMGAVIGAAANVRYGWDYNGILVPALLAVAWYQPTKLLSTMVEALVVYAACLVATRLPPLSKMLIVGSRRLLVAFVIGFFVKLAAGHALNRWAPNLQMIDYFGFGYLLPTLLATKMWNTGRVAVTTMSTLFISVAAFIGGNLVSFSLNAAFGHDQNEPVEELMDAPRLTRYPRGVQLMLMDSAPGPKAPEVQLGRLTPQQHALRLLTQLRAGEPTRRAVMRARAAGLWLGAPDQDGYRVLGPVVTDANHDVMAPRLAIRASTRPGKTKNDVLLLVRSQQPGDPVVPAADWLLSRWKARGLVIVSADPKRGALDESFIEQLADMYDVSRAVWVEETHERSALSVVGRLPQGLPVGELAAPLGKKLPIVFRAAESEAAFANSPRLFLNRADAEALAAAQLGAPPVLDWVDPMPKATLGRLEELTDVTVGGFAVRSVEELRLFGATIGRRHADAYPDDGLHETGDERGLDVEGAFAAGPTPFDRAMARIFQYRLVRLGTEVMFWGLVEPGPERVGNPTWWVRAETRENLVRANAVVPRLALEVPAPRWEIGTTHLALLLADGLGAQSFLLAGAMPHVAPDGLADVRSRAGIRSFYQRIHELLLDSEGRVVAVHGVDPARQGASGLLLAYRSNYGDWTEVPKWSLPLVELFGLAGVDPRPVDGGLDTNSFEGVTDPQMSYARGFGRGDMMMVWASAAVRVRARSTLGDARTARRLERLGARVIESEPSVWLERARQCIALGQAPPANASKDNQDCEPRALGSCVEPVAELVTYFERNNPYALRRALNAGCEMSVLRDPGTGLLWLAPNGLLTPAQLARLGLESAQNDGLLLVPLRGEIEWSAAHVRTRAAARLATSLGLRPVVVEQERTP